MDKDTVILVTHYGMGHADDALQIKLFKKYLTLLSQNSDLPAAMCFYTRGVELVTEDSPVLSELVTLESQGVRMIVCSTCLEYFGLSDQVKVGIVGGMPDIIEAQGRATKVITL